MNSNASLKFAEKNAHRCQNLRRWRVLRSRRRVKKTSALVLFVFAVLLSHRVFADDAAATSPPKFNFDSTRCSVWEGDVGDGFRKHAAEAGFNVGGGLGARAFGGEKHHDLLMADLHAGKMLG